MNLDQPNLIRITCAPSLSPYLQQELTDLGYAIELAQKTYVDIKGNLRDAMRLNLHLRTAFHILYLLKEFRCTSPQDLYNNATAFEWETIIPSNGYLSITSRVDHPSINSWTFANLKLKDAIVDRILQKTGRRPDSGPDRGRIVISLYWHGEQCSLYLDTSGNKLSDREYRRMPHKAPMQETLAAAVILATGYTGEGPLVNPMCGSGTLAIEAALIAQKRPPGLLRANYSVMHIKDFDAKVWEDLRKEALGPRRKSKPSPIIATDRDPAAINAAKRNAQTAGVDHLIEFAVCDFEKTPIPSEPGIVIVNPEYGERMGEASALAQTYEQLGDFFKKSCAGYTAYIFTGNLDLAKVVGLKASRRMEFFNADIDCRLLKYEMYKGSKEASSEPRPPGL